MRLAGPLDKMLAILRRDLLTAIRYRSGFLITAAGTAAELAAFYYLSRAIGPSFRPEGMDYFPFVLVGTGFYTFWLLGISAFLHDRAGSATDGHSGNTGHHLYIRAVVGSTECPFRVWPKYDPTAPFYRSRPSVMARRNSQPKCRSLRTDLPAVAPDRGRARHSRCRLAIGHSKGICSRVVAWVRRVVSDRSPVSRRDSPLGAARAVRPDSHHSLPLRNAHGTS